MNYEQKEIYDSCILILKSVAETCKKLNHLDREISTYSFNPLAIHENPKRTPYENYILFNESRHRDLKDIIYETLCKYALLDSKEGEEIFVLWVDQIVPIKSFFKSLKDLSLQIEESTSRDIVLWDKKIDSHQLLRRAIQ